LRCYFGTYLTEPRFVIVMATDHREPGSDFGIGLGIWRFRIPERSGSSECQVVSAPVFCLVAPKGLRPVNVQLGKLHWPFCRFGHRKGGILVLWHYILHTDSHEIRDTRHPLQQHGCLATQFGAHFVYIIK